VRPLVLEPVAEVCDSASEGLSSSASYNCHIKFISIWVHSKVTIFWKHLDPYRCLIWRLEVLQCPWQVPLMTAVWHGGWNIVVFNFRIIWRLYPISIRYDTRGIVLQIFKCDVYFPKNHKKYKNKNSDLPSLSIPPTRACPIVAAADGHAATSKHAACRHITPGGMGYAGRCHWGCTGSVPTCVASCSRQLIWGGNLDGHYLLSRAAAVVALSLRCRVTIADHPSDFSWAFANNPSPSLLSTPLRSTLCGSDWSFYSLHGEVDFH
jgi:hypothetical protein